MPFNNQIKKKRILKERDKESFKNMKEKRERNKHQIII